MVLLLLGVAGVAMPSRSIAMPGTQLYFQSHGGDLGWDDTCSFRCFPVCSLSGWPNVLPTSCAAVLGWLIPTASSWPPQSYNPVVYAQHSQLGSLELQGCLVQRLFLFPWCTVWPHLGFLQKLNCPTYFWRHVTFALSAGAMQAVDSSGKMTSCVLQSVLPSLLSRLGSI